MRQLQKVSQQLGVGLEVKKYTDPDSYREVTEFIQKENTSQQVDGVLILVSPESRLFGKRQKIMNLIVPKKDVDYLGDAYHAEYISASGGSPNQIRNDDQNIPSVCRAVLIALKKAGEVLAFSPRDSRILVVGNRGFWGQRVERTLFCRGYKQVSGIDRETKYLTKETKKSEVIITCVGIPNLIKGEMVNKGVTLVDVGLSYAIPDCIAKVVGDVEMKSVRNKAGFITPVPGGIGPLSIALVFKNLVYR